MRHNSAVIAFFTALALFVLWLVGEWLLLIFAGVLLAVLLRTSADWIAARTGVPPGWSLAIVVILILGAAAIATTLFLPSLAEQADALSRQLPQAATQLTDWLRQFTWGERLLQTVQTDDVPPEMVDRATTVASTMINGVVGIVIVLFVGLYLAANPTVYRRGVLHLIPLAHRARATDVMDAVTHTLRWWLLGQILSMVIVGLVMGVGLALIGVQLAFVLGVLAGLLEFIPVFGPPIAVIPALLLALLQSTEQALAVLVLYSIVQLLESYLLMPLVQQRAVHLPPVLTIAAQVVLGSLVGALGLLVAVPLTAALTVVVQKLYVQDALGDPMAIED